MGGEDLPACSSRFLQWYLMTRSLWFALTEPRELEICTKEGVGLGIPASEQPLDPVPGDIPEATLPREGP